MRRDQPEFATARKGYKTADVDGYVLETKEVVADLRSQIEAMSRDLADAYEEAAELRQQLQHTGAELEKATEELDLTRGQEEALRLTLVSASRTKDEMLAAAQLEAENMVAEASAQSASILSQARDEAERLSTENSALRAQIEQVQSQAEAERRAEADAFGARVASEHSERLQAVSELEALYETMAARLEKILEDAHRGVSDGRSDFAPRRAQQSHAAPGGSGAPPVVPSNAVPAAVGEASTEDRAPSPQPMSVLDRIAALAEPIVPLKASIETAPEPAEPSEVSIVAEPETAAASDDWAESLRSPDSQPSEESASVAADTAAGEEEPPDGVDDTRKSFYNRRSGKLPRLGDDKQKDTSSSMASLRDKS
jgi:cell division septum initiation protein DivIVA